MSWHGRYHRGAMRERRAAKRVAAEARHRAEQRRDHQRGQCRKSIGYPTRARASMALLNCRIQRALRGKTRRREQRVYHCQCGSWHLTSKAYLPYREYLEAKAS